MPNRLLCTLLTLVAVRYRATHNARLNLFQGGAPLHYRDIHWFNAPYIFKYCLKMVTPVLSKVSK